MSHRPKVSVIIPIYNVEKYIEQCARTLFEQTLDDIEYFFINDLTPDNSIGVLKEVLDFYPQRKEQVKIIEHEENKGVSAARNSGLKNARGEFLIHCDSDDWVEPEMYETLYNEAVSNSADIAWCNFFKNYSNGKVDIDYKQVQGDNFQYLRAILLSDGMTNYLWDKLVKRDLYVKNDIFFPEGIDIREDLLVVVKLFFYAQSVSGVEKALYHYRFKAGSISAFAREGKKFKADEKKVTDRIQATNLMLSFLEGKDVSEQFRYEIQTHKTNLLLLLLKNVEDIENLDYLYPEILNNGSIKVSLYEYALIKLFKINSGLAKVLVKIKELVSMKH